MTGRTELVVIGAGGHAKVVVATLLELGHAVAVILDDDPSRRAGRLLGVPVTGPIADYPTDGRPAILAIGDNATRHRLSAELDCRWQRVVHPTAWAHSSVEIGEGAFVAAGAVIQPDTLIGAHSIVNTGATVDHDCVVGSYVHIAPGAHLGGDVNLGEGVLVGLGAGVGPQVRIGDWTILGAGGVALSNLPARVTAVGIPARVPEDG